MLCSKRVVLRMVIDKYRERIMKELTIFNRNIFNFLVMVRYMVFIVISIYSFYLDKLYLDLLMVTRFIIFIALPLAEVYYDYHNRISEIYINSLKYIYRNVFFYLYMFSCVLAYVFLYYEIASKGTSISSVALLIMAHFFFRSLFTKRL